MLTWIWQYDDIFFLRETHVPALETLGNLFIISAVYFGNQDQTSSFIFRHWLDAHLSRHLLAPLVVLRRPVKFKWSSCIESHLRRYWVLPEGFQTKIPLHWLYLGVINSFRSGAEEVVTFSQVSISVAYYACEWLLMLSGWALSGVRIVRLRHWIMATTITMPYGLWLVGNFVRFRIKICSNRCSNFLWRWWRNY
jgi:hypothetical protein